MKFKARLEKEQVLQLHAVITSLEKIGSRAAILLNPECVKISLINDNLDSIRCFCELQVNDIFIEYRISSNNENSILLECSLNFFLQSLGSGKTATECVLKLVKRGDMPCLCVEAKASGGLTVDIVHDIPIKLHKVTDMVHYLPPDVPPPSVALALTRVKLMRSVIDKMSKLARAIQLTAHQVGRLAFKVDGLCRVSSYITGLTPCYEGTPLDVESDRNNIASVMVDNRKLAALFGIAPLLTHHALLFLSEQSAVVVHVNGLLGTQGSLTCYLPVLIQGGLEDFLEGDGESATGHEIETEIGTGTGTGAETEAPVGTESQMGMEESSQIRPDNTDSMRSEGRKRKIQDDINSDEGENQGS